MQPITCACKQCASMCEHSTCLPTPAEARELIRRGFADRLATYRFWPQPDKLAFVGPAPAGKEGADLSTTKQGACTFYVNGLCELHALGLKPLEGRLAHHDRPWLPIREHVAGQWRGMQFVSVKAALSRTTERMGAA